VLSSDIRVTILSFLKVPDNLNVISVPLNLGPFSLEQYGQAIRHSAPTPCFLLAEIHTCLAYNIRQVTGVRNTASTSLYESLQDDNDDPDAYSIHDLLTSLAARGSNWERSPLRSTANRDGWQDAIIGLLKDVL
jgi:bromodomain adjacent to zinc finger domain protein 1A